MRECQPNPKGDAFNIEHLGTAIGLHTHRVTVADPVPSPSLQANAVDHEVLRRNSGSG